MHRSSLLAGSALLLLATGSAAQEPKFDPYFDYTNLRPSDDDVWSLLNNITVPLEGAIEVARTAEGKIRVARAELLEDGGLFWRLYLFVEAGEGKAKRVDVEVSAAEPKVLKRVELNAFAPGEAEIWTILSGVEVLMEGAIPVVKEAARGDKDKEALQRTQVRTAKFGAEGKNPHWDLELFGLDGKNGLVRRIEYQASAVAPRVQRKILRDRFPGEPLRKAKPVQHPSGMWVHDFQEGDGPLIAADSRVRVHYRLLLLDDTKVHDTFVTKMPETFLVSAAPLDGMTEGMLGMRVGGRRKIAIPYDLAFGAQGNELVPPKAMIVCDVDVLSLESP